MTELTIITKTIAIIVSLICLLILSVIAIKEGKQLFQIIKEKESIKEKELIIILAKKTYANSLTITLMGIGIFLIILWITVATIQF